MLKAAASTLHSALEAVLRPLGMTITHYACLELLAQRPGLSNSELAGRRPLRHRELFFQDLNALLQALERQGPVVRPAQGPVGGPPTELTARGAGSSKGQRRGRGVEQGMLADLDAATRSDAAPAHRASPH